VRNFKKAKYTAILSDFHLCEAEPRHSRDPFWKKYKTEEFFFDDKFESFLNQCCAKAGGEPVELVLNGDIFDFDSVVAQPNQPPYRVTWLERHRGLHPEEDKSVFKITKILEDHPIWVNALSEFIKKGNRVIFVVGNHDVEIQWPTVQDVIHNFLGLSDELKQSVRFVEWFYISNGDTLIEHGNQYDPYCICTDPIHPFIIKFNRLEARLPFGNLACRYMINGMGYFNPHVDTNYLLSIKEYLKIFTKYMWRSQPLILWTWFWSSFVTLGQTLLDHLTPAVKDPLTVEDRIDVIAKKANATPRMVRELRELFVTPAASSPYLVARELWLDRAMFILIFLMGLFYAFLFIKQIFNISFFWMFIPILILVPFFLFYARSIRSEVTRYKEPQERILSVTSLITKVNRIVYGHTHVVRHEIIGSVEHLNSGTWSPAFLDVECTQPVDQKTFVWIYPGRKDCRESRLYKYENDEFLPVYRRKEFKEDPIKEPA
jgi:UDP-2,3-diacylglucosamine pyrophosphatase LpxH